MKKLLALFLLLNVTSSAQTIFEKSWSSDFNFFVNDVAIDDQGNAYFACSGFNAAIDSSISVVVKTDADFEIIWSNWYRTLKRDDLGSIELLSDGNLLLGGTMRQDFATDEGGGLIKIDPDGNVLWHKVISGAFDERVIFTSELPAGQLASVVRYGVFNQPTSIVTTDALGTILERYELFEGETAIQLEDAVMASDGTFYATGSVFNTDLGRNGTFIACFSITEGLWLKKYDLGETSLGFSISVHSSGRIAVGGLIVDPESVFGGSNGILLVTDDLGEVDYAYRIYREANGFSEITSGVSWQADGNLLVSMNFLSDVGNFPLLGKFDGDGGLLWSVAIENGEGTNSNYLATLADGRLLTGGRNFNGEIILNALTDEGTPACNEAPAEFDLEVLTPVVQTGSLSFASQLAESIELPIEVTPWPIEENEICSQTVSTFDQEARSPVVLYPNPAQDHVSLIVPSGVNKLEVTGTDGKRVLVKQLKIGNSRLNVERFAPGIYLFHFYGSRGSEVHRLAVR
jgi:hypothetical protein